MVGEVIGGYLAHSLAIMTDAAHLLTDVGSMSVSLFSLWVSARPPTKTMSFGWHRSETLGALASVLSIWVVTGALVYLAAARIISNDYEIEARAMLATSASAVGVNLVMAYILHQAPAVHGHGGYEQLESAGGCLPSHAPLPGSTSVRAAFVHVVGDLLQSFGVLVAATIIYFKPQCKIADPISTLFFSVFVLGSTLTILRDVFRVLMEGAPRGIQFDAVKEALLAVSGVRGTHDLHVWALTLSHPVVSVHVAVGECPAPAHTAPRAGLGAAGLIVVPCRLQMPAPTPRQCCGKPPASCRANSASCHVRCRWSGTRRRCWAARTARTPHPEPFAHCGTGAP
uniref:Probable proton-coupled zinc antiporter SLC30A3 n=1 Tax=Anser cygnoides TaxID=8845 RepID=A0A8B9EAQ6_ANSCY